MFIFPLLCISMLLIFSAKADTGNVPDLPKSLCPEVFRYDSVDRNVLRATLLAKTPHILHGVWIRVIFNKDIDQLLVEDNFGEVVPREGKNGFLIKNKDLLLRSGRGKVVKISVKFSGSEIPNLIEYRLNGVTVCPSFNSNRTDFYPNDPLAASSNYLQSVISKHNDATTPNYKCGELTSNQPANTYPWQASLFVKLNEKENYMCDCTLVSPKYVITAAHCVTFLENQREITSDKLVVYFGKENIEEQGGQKPYSVADIIIYPGFETENLLNDIALIELREPIPVQISETIRPICLPTKSTGNGEETLLVGYQLENKKFNRLASAKVKKIADEECFSRSESLKSLLGDNTYCVSYLKDNAACVGGSGSGSISYTAGRWELKGVLSVSVALQNLGGAGQQDKCDDSSNLLLTEINRYSKWINGVIFQ